MSVYQALLHSSAKLGKKLSVEWIDSERFENGNKDEVKFLNKFDGYLFREDLELEEEGIIKSINYARQKDIPFLESVLDFNYR